MTVPSIGTRTPQRRPSAMDTQLYSRDVIGGMGQRSSHPCAFVTERQASSIRSPYPPPLQRTVMKISARNRIKGTIIEIRKGATTAHIRIDIGNGAVITSSITNEAVDELGLAVGNDAYAVVKASDVMVAVD
jgi:molybdopterin-binding protein